MQLTLDSKQPLTDVLRVVGALYGVTLTADAANHHTADTAVANRARSARSRGTHSRSTVRGRGGTSGAASTADVRAWARAHDYAIGVKGPIPAAVVASYQVAHRR